MRRSSTPTSRTTGRATTCSTTSGCLARAATRPSTSSTRTHASAQSWTRRALRRSLPLPAVPACCVLCRAGAARCRWQRARALRRLLASRGGRCAARRNQSSPLQPLSLTPGCAPRAPPCRLPASLTPQSGVDMAALKAARTPVHLAHPAELVVGLALAQFGDKVSVLAGCTPPPVACRLLPAACALADQFRRAPPPAGSGGGRAARAAATHHLRVPLRDVLQAQRLCARVPRDRCSGDTVEAHAVRGRHHYDAQMLRAARHSVARAHLSTAGRSCADCGLPLIPANGCARSTSL